MRLTLLAALVLTSGTAFAQTAALPQIRSTDRQVVLRAQPTQTVDDAGRQIDPRAPLASASVSTAVTITGVETFQQLLPANPARLGCMIQNKSATSIVRIFLGTVAQATAPRSTDLDPGDSFNCAAATNLVITDAIAASATVANTPVLVVTQ